jgi:hypothetical protein
MGFISRCRRTGWRFNSEPKNFLNPVCDFGIGPRARRKSLSVRVQGRGNSGPRPSLPWGVD